MFHQHASRALALGCAVAALAAPSIALASPMDAQPQGSQTKAAIQQNVPPTWPVNAQPLRASQAPADDGVAWSTIVLTVAGVGLIGGVAVVARRLRVRTRRTTA